MADDTRTLMDTAMGHNRKLFSAALSKMRSLGSPAAAPAATASGKPVSPEFAARKAVIDKQFQDKAKKLQQKYAGKISPKRMQEIHSQMGTNLQPGSALSPSSAAVLRRALVAGAPAPTAGTLETSAPFAPNVAGSPLQ